MEAANSSGVAVPLVIVEDKSGQVYKFVYHGGPKYLFEVIQANLENIHLVRCALSLLIIIITLLRRKLPDSTGGHKDSALFSANTSDSIAAWVSDTLAKIGDASAVSVCVNVLITSYNPSVQELALSLLASMLMVSDEAVKHMLLPYSSSGTVVVQDAADEPSRKNSYNRNNSSGRPSSVEQLDGAMGQAGAAFNNNSSNNKAPMDYTQHKPKPVDFKKLNFSYNTMDYTAKRVQMEKPPKEERPSTCLSYVLSVLLLQKNRHLLAAGCADIILAMLRKNRRDMGEAIAQSPTCELPAIDERKSKMETRNSFSKFTTAPEENAAPKSNPLSTVVIEWAGLKLLLKFLFRYEKMNAQSRTATKAIDRESVSASLRLKEEFAYAHARVFAAVCQLIAASPVVAAQANKLDGAEDLLTFTFSRIDPNDSQMYNYFVAATNALTQDKALQAQRRARQLALQKYGGRIPPDVDIRLSDYMGSEGAHVKEPAPQERPVTPKELYDRLHRRGQPASSVSPSRSTQNTGKKGKQTGTQVSSSVDARLGSLPRKQVLSNSVELGRNIKVNFQAEYDVETEKRELYLLNSYDAKYGVGGNTGLKTMAKQTERAAAQRPLAYHPEADAVMGSSLESIGAAALRPITLQKPQLTEEQRREMEFLLGSSGASAGQSQAHTQPSGGPSGTLTHTNTTGGLPAQHSVTASQDSSSYPGRQRERGGGGRADGDEMVFANSQDFFSSLRAQPVIPRRIEPRDVIAHEDLATIRVKFKALAEEAKRSGEEQYCCTLATYDASCDACDRMDNAGKSEKAEGTRDSQQELIRRVYGPRSFKYYDPKAPSQQYDEEGNPLPFTASTKRPGSSGKGSRSRSPSSKSPYASRKAPGIAPIQPEADYFASFSDASGTALQDVPIQPGGAKSAVGGGYGLQSLQGLEGMDFSVDHLNHFALHGSSATSTSDGPDVYGLRLENFDFDEQHLFEGFKPIFSVPPPESDRAIKPKGPDPTVLSELGVGRKSKPQMEMAQTVDLIMS